MNTNYSITGNDNFSQEVLAQIGLVGFDTVAIGLVGRYDTRDNQNSPAEGMFLPVNKSAYREDLGGDEDFDAYVADLRFYNGSRKGRVLATRLTGRWPNDAPPAGLS